MITDFFAIPNFLNEQHFFNEWFARDTSRKVKAALKAKFAAGERIGPYAPIGYCKDPDQKNHLVIDEETRWIVEDIFDLAYHGMGAYKIMKRLTEAEVPTPAWLNYQRYGTFSHIFDGQEEAKQRYQWTPAQVKSILKDETYIGNTIHNRQTNISYKNKKRVRKPEDQWERVESTHEAIISREVFDRVQQQISSRRRQQKDATTQMFSGLVRCADCGWSMSFATNTQVKNPFSYFNCTAYRQFGKGTCTAHYIRYDTLYAFVLARLQYWAQEAQADEEKLLQRLLRAGDRERAAETKKAADTLKKAQKRKKELDALFARLYEDRVSGKISEYNFSMLSQKYQAEQAEVEETISNFSQQIDKSKQDASNVEKWVALVKQHTHVEELNADLLNTLIEKIVVHDAIKHEDGTREQEIEIFYRFVGKID